MILLLYRPLTMTSVVTPQDAEPTVTPTEAEDNHNPHDLAVSREPPVDPAMMHQNNITDQLNSRRSSEQERNNLLSRAYHVQANEIHV